MSTSTSTDPQGSNTPDDQPSLGVPLLEVRDVGRSFGPVRALDGVSFSVSRGEVVGLIGENGAGKSTVLNIVSGTDHQDRGEVLLRGRPIRFKDYHEATRNGVFRIFQELALVQTMSVWENFLLSHEEHFTRAGVVRRRAARKWVQELLARFDHGWIDPDREVASYPFAVRQVLEILKAFALAELLGQDEPVILLDEPTAALSSDEIDFLKGLLMRVKPHSAIVFVSHRLSELLDWSDRIVVFKDGQVTAEAPAAELTEGQLHFVMVGRERDTEFYRENRQRTPEASPALEVAGLEVPGAFSDIDLTLHRGEIIGIAGVLGSGKSEVGRAIFGALDKVTGSMSVEGRTLDNWNATTMARLRVGYVSPERKDDGLLDTFNVAQNISFARIATQKRGWLSLGDEAKAARRHIEALRIKTASARAPIDSLSGGNQQKVILARWLERGVDVLILDNPTRGVDAGAKEEIYEIIRDLADAGVAVLLISDDLLEVIGLSNGIAVMKDGRITLVVDSPPDDKPSEAGLVATMV